MKEKGKRDARNHLKLSEVCSALVFSKVQSSDGNQSAQANAGKRGDPSSGREFSWGARVRRVERRGVARRGAIGCLGGVGGSAVLLDKDVGLVGEGGGRKGCWVLPVL